MENNKNETNTFIETMREVKTIDLNKIVGLYPICNTGCLVIHEIDDRDEQVKVSLNGDDPDWYPMAFEPEDGFLWGDLFVPFEEVQAVR